ncbi:ale o 1 allergen [Dermatophagoides farinae]|uniref:Ale o 1 allergen n=2 Tax=Dermatophagoides farinae TaxID=6954 RepID=A0A9D4SMK2_DERFA|nr:ale o 1 allergen [Dermatophagoides farinae]
MKSYCLSILLILSSLVNFSITSPLLDDRWIHFKETYNRQYANEQEEQYRRNIFMKNAELIEQHNRDKYSKGLSTFELGLNKFADMTLDEFRSKHNGYRDDHQKSSNNENYNDNDISSLPDEIDWTKRGVVTPVKDQGRCGSCWAFSAVASIESQHALKTGKLIELSEQNLVDCSRPEGNHGCEGGYMDNGFKMVIKNHGIDTEKSYPYKGMDEKCRQQEKNKTIGATIHSYVDVKYGDEHALQSAVAKIGPISVAIDADSLFFMFYTSGIYNNENCSSDFKHLDHGVAVVGYGELNGIKYWKVKNSWGTNWGIDGYVLMSRDKNNQCGIATRPSYPVV